MVNIRKATYRDAPGIKALLQGMGYPMRISQLVSQLDILFNKEDHEVFVYELHKEIVGFVFIHYLPQLTFEGNLLLISYLTVDESSKHATIARELEQYVAAQAKNKKCETIQVHSMDWREPSYEFYVQQGYQEYPRYFIKKLIYVE